MKFREKIITVVAMTLLISGSIAIVFGGILFSLEGFFSLIGVTYESTGVLVRFILYCLLIGIIFEIIEKIILFFIVKTNVHKKEQFFWIILVKVGLTWIVIHTVNEFMTTIYLTGSAEFLTALLIVSVDVIFDDDKKVQH